MNYVDGVGAVDAGARLKRIRRARAAGSFQGKGRRKNWK